MPLLALGLGATVVGTGLQMAGNAKSQSAINAARSAEVQKQEQLQRQSSATFNQSLADNSADTANKTLDKGAAERGGLAAMLKAATSTATAPPAPTSPQGYTVTGGNPQQGAEARAGAAGNSWSNIVGNAANKLGSYGDLQTAQGINNSNANLNLGVTANKARGWANLLPLQVEVASHKGDALSSWGSIVQALGSVASLAGATAGAGASATPLSQVSNYPMANAMLNNAGAAARVPAWGNMWSNF